MKTSSNSKRSPRKTASSAKLDLMRLFRSDYVAPKTPALIDTKPGRYLCIEGTGAPGGPEFVACIGALYGIAYTIKMTRKFAGKADYVISKLEARYLNLDGTATLPPSEWRWQLLIRTPDAVTTVDLAEALGALRKRGKEGDAARVEIQTIDEGRCVQMLHIGPYDQEQTTIAAMDGFARTNGLRLAGPHHEIYLSDPRRVAPGKLKTILRLGVQANSPEPKR